LYSLIERLGVEGPVQPEHAYAVAREAGVSYEAAIRQLTHLEVIGGDEAAALWRRRPLQVKADLALGRRPVNGYADVWPVDEGWDDQLLALRVEDEVVISLPENRSTGYRWMFQGEHAPRATSAEPPASPGSERSPLDVEAFTELRRRFAEMSTSDKPTRVPGTVIKRLRSSSAARSGGWPLPIISGADIVGDDYLPARAPWLPPRQARRFRLAQQGLTPQSESELAVDAAPRIAGTGRRLLGVRFGRPGPATLRLEYRSPYSDDDPVEKYVLHAFVEPRRVGFSVDQLATDPHDPWTTQVRKRQLERPLDPLPDDEELDTTPSEDEPAD
jgi:hypothetical protein